MYLLSLILLVTLQRPTLSVAQSMVESGANIHAIGKVGEKGAFQVREKYWGKVPKTYIAQAKQAEGILDTLINRYGDINIALERYNGLGEQAVQYASAVRVKTFELSIMGI